MQFLFCCFQVKSECSFLLVILIGCCFFLVCSVRNFLVLLFWLLMKCLVKVLDWMLVSMFFMFFLMCLLMMCGFEMQLLNLVVLEIDQCCLVMLFFYIRFMMSLSLCSILKYVICGWQFVLVSVLKLVWMRWLMLLQSMVCLLNRLVLVFLVKVVLMMLVWVLLIVFVQDSVRFQVLFEVLCLMVMMFGMLWLVMNL